MRLGWKASLVAAAMVCVAAPALGSSADATFVAVDNAWRANGTSASSLTVAPGQTVTFSYPEGMASHNLVFTDRQPDCTGLVPYPRTKGWTGSCTFPQAGTYPFLCQVHDGMAGTVVVAVPTPSPAPTSTAGPGDPSTPAATPTATPGVTATGTETGTAPAATAPQATVKLRVASRQKGTRVRGSVDVVQAGSRIVVTVRSGKAKAGSWTRGSSAAGTVAFSVPLDAKRRKALRAKRRLKLTVTVALTPPGAKTLTTTAKATVSL